MTIGERIKQARKIRGMSQRELAKRAEVSAQAISKYERDINAPSSGVLLRLAKALGVGVEFFVRPRSVLSITPDYRRRQAFPRKRVAALIAEIADWLERYIEIERILRPDEGGLAFEFPSGYPRAVSSMEEVEEAALDLRRAWDLGSDPIENLVHLLEDRGIKVGVIDSEDDRFDACTFFAGDDGRAPVVVARSKIPGDRQRFSIAHELGHLMIEPGEGLDAERAAHRFAGAFLVPEKAARFELAAGKGLRRDLSDFELLALKQKYGMSMQAWIYRAKDLGIISEERGTGLFKKFRARGWHKREPGAQISSEWPMRFEILVNLALAEEAISKRRAEELLNRPVEESFAEDSEASDSSAEKLISDPILVRDAPEGESMEYEIGPISSEDRKEIVEIFNFYVENSFAAFPEKRVPTEFFNVLMEACRGYPAFAARDAGGRVLGFALLRPHHPMPAFSSAAEISIFIHPEFKGRGKGRSLVERLVDEAKRMGISSILASISSRNEESIAFHGRLGFRECGRFKSIGKKWGEDFDVIWMQKML